MTHSIKLLGLSLIATLASSAFGLKLGTFHGSYASPGPTEKAAFSTFDNDFKLERNAQDKLVLSYKLPEELVEKDGPTIVLTEKSKTMGMILLVNEEHNDIGSCRITEESLVCMVLYPRLDTGLETVKKQITTKFVDATDFELDQRFGVATAFSHDPKGIVYMPFDKAAN